MKKIISSLCALAITLMAVMGGAIFAQAGTYEEECDLVFLKAFEQILIDEGIVVTNTEIKKESVYDMSLNQLGYVYTMDVAGDEGYAIIVNTDGIFEVTELFLNATSPYNEYDGQKVYVSAFMYLIYQDGEFVETSTGIILGNETVDLLSQKAFYAAASSLWYDSATIYYTSRTPTEYKLGVRYPTYFIGSQLSNACTPTSGASIIGYYTRYYPELIPGFNPGSYFLDTFIYTEMVSDVKPVIETLYNYMGTNTLGAGTTIDQFKKGMTKYVNEKGRSISYNSCMQNGNFNFDTAKQRLMSGMPLILFVDTFSVATMSNSAGQEYFDYLMANACHAMAGFGYSEINYTLTNGQARTDKYIIVSTGLMDKLKGYYNINYYTQVDDVYGINIY